MKKISCAVACSALAAASGITFDLADTAGVRHTSRELENARAAVFVFVENDCPMSNSYAPELARIHDDYAARGVLFFAVDSGPMENASAVREHALEYNRPFPTLLDPGASLARATSASVTPEVVVLSAAGQVLYRGRIDDRYFDYGKARTRVTRHDLRTALDEILAGKAVLTPFTKSFGCAIQGVARQ